MTIERDADFIVTLIKQVLSEDPSKIIDAIDDYQRMLAAGAIFEGDTREEVMAEYVIYMMKEMNPHIPELIDAINLNYEDIERQLIVWFKEQGY